jgi:AcrR family transcriptional regulator
MVERRAQKPSSRARSVNASSGRKGTASTGTASKSKVGPRAEAHPRDTGATKARLVEAVGTLLAREGFGAIGLRAVAAEAGADKKLIYRYFGGLPELLEAYAEGTQFWPTNEELAGRSLEELRRLPLRKRWAVVVKNYIAELRRRPLTREILRWELFGRNEVTARLERVRETRGVALTNALAHDLAPDVDAPAVLALLSSAVHYLLVRAEQIRWFNGIDLQSSAGWARLEQVALASIEPHLRPR